MRKTVVLAAAFALLAASGAGATPAREQSTCPRTLLPLGENAIAPATAAALRSDSAKNNPRITGATLATSDAVRGKQAKTECGTGVWKRTIVVYLVDRAMLPSQSLAQRIVYVGRTSSGYWVWGRVH
ncbi:MAG TPA: hypothetical protein VGL76_04210 [Gaiellaceae bacterium]